MWSPRTPGYATTFARKSRLVSSVHSGSGNGTFWTLQWSKMAATQNFTPLPLSGQWDVVDVVPLHAWVCHNICPEEPSGVQCPILMSSVPFVWDFIDFYNLSYIFNVKNGYTC